jgi:hypothetical protein
MSRIAREEVSDNGGMRISAVERNYGENDWRFALSRNMETRSGKPYGHCSNEYENFLRIHRDPFL